MVGLRQTRLTTMALLDTLKYSFFIFMTQDADAQFDHFLSGSRHVLIALPENPDGDAIGSGWALAHFFAKKKISCTVAFSDPHKKIIRFSFLPRPQNIIHTLSGTRDFLLSFKTKHNDILTVRTEREKESLDIYITPRRGMIDPRDFSFAPALFHFDLVIAVGAPERQSFGMLFEESPDLFFEVPLINIDYHNTNDQYGQINFVHPTASSSAEIITDLIQKHAPEFLDETIAHCLLTGIVSATDSFQKGNTTPKSLQRASLLIHSGADQQKIIHHLYKSQPLSLLKLWGCVMSKLQWKEDIALLWSVVTQEDFAKSKTTPATIEVVLEKIKRNYSSGKIFLLLYQNINGQIRALVDFSRLTTPLPGMRQLHGQSKDSFYLFTPQSTTLAAAEKEVLEKLSEKASP